MENAVDALKIAAAILVFIIAISSSFSLFGTAKHTADSIINMRDKQAYLDAAEEEYGGILYTSTETVADERAIGVNKYGDRIVSVEDVVSTIYRYYKEKYGVTILKQDGTVLARYDSNTDAVMSQWYNIVDAKDESGNLIARADEQKENFVNKIKDRIDNKYIKKINIKLDPGILANLYYIDVQENSRINCGAPWYGNEEEIEKKIACDLSGDDYIKNTQKYNHELAYEKKLLEELRDKKIIEVTNEIDQSTYLKQTDDDGNPIKDINGNELYSDLLQEYEMPAVEIVYIIMES